MSRWPGVTDSALLDLLAEARRRGFLGPGPVGDHLAHARAYRRHLPPDGPFLDLGSGGGVPGLVLAADDPAGRWVLLDAGHRRTAFLTHAVGVLGMADRVEVATDRAEVAGHDPARRGRFGAVVARSFGPPPVVAECGAPFLRVGGRLVVSEPPTGGDRWPSAGLARVGLELAAAQPGPPALAVLVQRRACPPRYPRRVGVPVKRPLW